MNERIKEFAEQAGIEYSSQWTYWTAYGQDLELFAELVRQDERDKCAQDCCDSMEESRRNERYIKEMEQPTPKQSGTFAITVSKVCDADALPPTANAVYWMDMVVANLVRNGVNKHRARELAYHFYTYTTPLENSNG